MYPARLFSLCFQREPGPGCRVHLEHLTQTLGLSLEQAAEALMQSPEYLSRNALSSPHRPVAYPRPRLCFLHVEKTAGTSLHAYFSEIYPAEEIFPERLQYLDRYSDEQYEAARLYSGHYTYSHCSRMPCETQFMTFVRKPEQRILSLYYFWRSKTEETDTAAVAVAQRCGLAEFLRHPDVVPHVRNGQKWRLVENGSVEEACALLDSFAFVGVQEYYTLSVLLLAARFGWPVPSRAWRRLDVNDLKSLPGFRTVPREPITPEIAELLSELTTEDTVLYHHALRRFERDFNKMFDADLSC